ncbi:MAG: M48 family metalloprotease [Gammaproteobacteria bacterium]
MKKLLFIVLIGLSNLLTTGCATNPVTGKSDFVTISEDQEIAMGRQGHAEVMKRYTLYENPELQNYVQRVGKKLAAESHRPELVYRFHVLDSTEINAFALPGGYIYITRGLMSYLNSEAEFAAVLGHEIGHVTARHSVRQASAAQVAGIGATIGAIFLPQLRTQAGQQVVNMAGGALLSGYGRQHELESDRLGAEYLARTGYTPQAMLDVISVLKDQQVYDQALAKEEGREPRQYHGVFASHPDNDTRLQEVVAAANKYKKTGNEIKNQSEYLALLENLVIGESAREGVLRDGNFYHTEMGFAMSFPRGWKVQNLPDRLVASSPDGGAILQVGVEDINKRISPREFMRTRLKLDPLKAEGKLNPDGLDGHSAVAPIKTSFGTRDSRFNVIYLNDSAFILAGVVKDESQIPAYDKAFLASAKSFHRITNKERELAKPLRLHMIKVKPGMTIAKLAKQTPFTDHAEERLRLLNGLFPAGEVKPGQIIKMVR